MPYTDDPLLLKIQMERVIAAERLVVENLRSTFPEVFNPSFGAPQTKLLFVPIPKKAEVVDMNEYKRTRWKRRGIFRG